MMHYPYEYPNEMNGSDQVAESSHLSSEKMELDDVDDVSTDSEETCENRKDELVLSPDRNISDSENLHSHSCPYCWKSFRKSRGLKRHLYVHSDSALYPYKCPNCDRCFTIKKSYKFHMSLHEKNSKGVFHYADCEFQSSEAASIKYHQLRRHAKVYGFHCHRCAEVFQNESTFLEHMKVHDAAICSLCGFACRNAYHLSQLVLEHRDNENDEVKCDNEQHKDKCQVDVNYNATEEECKPEKMDLRLYGNEDLHELDRDLDSLKEKRYLKCSRCRWSFRSAKLLKKHFQRHLRSFKCDHCDAVFKYRASFVKHINKHEY